MTTCIVDFIEATTYSVQFLTDSPATNGKNTRRKKQPTTQSVFVLLAASAEDREHTHQISIYAVKERDRERFKSLKVFLFPRK